jgi:hypothetical protein
MLELIRTGRNPMPPRFLLYGEEGIGKSTVASEAPNAIIIDVEDGLSEISCARFPVAHSLEDVLLSLGELVKADHPYGTVVIDSLDALEKFIWDRVCQEFGVNSIERADGGYQRGYVHALVHWRKVINALAELRNVRRMACILIAHAQVQRFESPESPAYDRFSPRLNKHACAMIVEWCDGVLFATRRMRTEVEDRGFGRTRTIAKEIGKDGGDRIFKTVASPSAVAKNRYGLPAEIPLSWAAIMAGISKETSSMKG